MNARLIHNCTNNSSLVIITSIGYTKIVVTSQYLITFPGTKLPTLEYIHVREQTISRHRHYTYGLKETILLFDIFFFQKIVERRNIYIFNKKGQVFRNKFNCIGTLPVKVHDFIFFSFSLINSKLIHIHTINDSHS